MEIKQVTIIPTVPFNFDATFYKPDHFTSGDNIWQPGVRWQTWRWKSSNSSKTTNSRKRSFISW